VDGFASAVEDALWRLSESLPAREVELTRG
jgi:hypothetical protein